MEQPGPPRPQHESHGLGPEADGDSARPMDTADRMRSTFGDWQAGHTTFGSPNTSSSNCFEHF
jgi:hypothetical protein